MNLVHKLLTNKVLILCGVLYVAVVVARLSYGLSHIVFSQDQARDALLVEQWASDGNWIVPYGPKASVGNFYLPPLYYQLHLFISAATGFRPLVMQWVIILIEAATPVVLFLLLKRAVRPGLAFTVAALYGLFATPTIFGSFAWNPNMIPFFVSLALYAWVRLLTTKSYWWIFVGVLSVTIAFHLHYQSVVILPFAGLVFVLDVFKRWKRVQYWLYASVLGFLTLAPYFSAELQSNWQNTRQIFLYFTQEHSQYFDRVTKSSYVLHFIPGFFERVMFGNATESLGIGRAVMVIGLLAGAVLSLKSKVARYIMLYVLSILVMLRLYKGDKLDYYLMTLFMAPTVLLSFTFQQLPRITVVLLLPLAFMTIGYLQSMPAFNNLATLRSDLQQLRSVLSTSEVGLLFHDDDAVNTFAYALSDSKELQPTPRALTVIDVCSPSTSCHWNLRLMCQSNRAATYAALLKSTGGYTYQKTLKTQRQTFLIGTLERPVEQVGYSLFDERYGSDLLLKNVYTK